MSLEEKHAATHAGAASRIPPEWQAIMHHAPDDLRNAATTIRRGLPVPSRFVRFVQAGPDCTGRPEPETTLEALRNVAG